MELVQIDAFRFELDKYFSVVIVIDVRVIVLFNLIEGFVIFDWLSIQLLIRLRAAAGLKIKPIMTLLFMSFRCYSHD